MDAPVLAIAPTHVHTFMRYCAVSAYTLNAAPAYASAAWPTANKAFFYPIYLPHPYPVKRLFVENGGTASGTFDVGIYSVDGTKLISAGSTTQTGTNTHQYVTGFDAMLLPGSYYLGMSASSTALTVFRSNTFGLNIGRSSGVLEQTTAHPLPATLASAVGLSVAYFPMFGFTLTASGF